MRFPTLATPIATSIDLGWFAICSTKADADTRGLEGDLAGKHQDVKHALGARNQVRDDLTLARAVRAVAWRRGYSWLKQLNLDLTAAVGGKRKDVRLQRVLPLAPAKVFKLGRDKAREAFRAAVEALDHPDTPASAKAAKKAGAALLAEIVAADKEIVAKERQLDEAQKAIVRAREAWLVGYRGLFGALTVKFPEDKQMVESFFESPAAPAAERKAKKEPPPA